MSQMDEFAASSLMPNRLLNNIENKDQTKTCKSHLTERHY